MNYQTQKTLLTPGSVCSTGHTPKATLPNHGSEISHRGVGAMHIENLCPPPSASTRRTETRVTA